MALGMRSSSFLHLLCIVPDRRSVEDCGQSAFSRAEKKETSMNHQSWKTVLGAAIVCFSLAAPLRAQWTDSIGCTDATLQGDYAFTLHGESLGVLVPQTGAPPKLVPFASPLPADGVAITHFDGHGNLTQVDFVMRNGTSAATPVTPVTVNGFRTGETGSYSVSSDCTGTFRITFPDTTEIHVAFVLGDFGRRIRTVVTRQHVPQLPPAIIPAGTTCAAGTGGCDLGVQIRSDGIKSESGWE
jgi:hypothetical protein